jgi:very-short-patch-repair endonuclease
LDLSWRNLPPADIRGGITSPARTVLDCAATLAFDEALAIADSALRSGRVSAAAVRARAAHWPGRGHRRVQRVADAADPRSSGPIESVLRAICLDIPGLTVTPQLRVERDGRFVAVVDLADERLRIVIEAEGFEFHGDRAAFDRDCQRYDDLVAAGWVVLRFTWEQIMRQEGWVREILVATVSQQRVCRAGGGSATTGGIPMVTSPLVAHARTA